MIRAFISFIAVIAVVLTAPTAASAASSTQIHQDAADNGYLDGDYTAAEIRDANRTVPAQQREYTLWDDIVADYLRRLSNPSAPKAPIVPVQDFNDNGEIDSADVATARKLTRKAQKKAIKAKAGDEAAPGDVEATPLAAAPADSDADESDDGSSFGIIALLVGVPVVIVGFGIWRMRRSARTKPDNNSTDDDTHSPDA